ncbi:MAG: hypothetical protein V4649_04490 [Bacteroidota bacterium]
MAKQMKDIVLEGDDLEIVAGDLFVAESTAQHQQQLILNNKGDYKQNPTICVGAAEFFDDEHFQRLIREISVQFTKDGMEVNGITLSTDGIITSNATYK